MQTYNQFTASPQKAVNGNFTLTALIPPANFSGMNPATGRASIEFPINKDLLTVLLENIMKYCRNLFLFFTFYIANTVLLSQSVQMAELYVWDQSEEMPGAMTLDPQTGNLIINDKDQSLVVISPEGSLLQSFNADSNLIALAVDGSEIIVLYERILLRNTTDFSDTAVWFYLPSEVDLSGRASLLPVEGNYLISQVSTSTRPIFRVDPEANPVPAPGAIGADFIPASNFNSAVGWSTGMAIGPDNQLYVAVNGYNMARDSTTAMQGIFRFDAATGVRDTRFASPKSNVYDIQFGPDNHLYALQDGGVHKYDGTTGDPLGRVVHFVQDTEHLRMAIDPSGTIFVLSTLEKKLFKTEESVASPDSSHTFPKLEDWGWVRYSPGFEFEIDDVETGMNEKYWVLSRNLMQFDKSSGKISEITTQTGRGNELEVTPLDRGLVGGDAQWLALVDLANGSMLNESLVATGSRWKLPGYLDGLGTLVGMRNQVSVYDSISGNFERDLITIEDTNSTPISLAATPEGNLLVTFSGYTENNLRISRSYEVDNPSGNISREWTSLLPHRVDHPNTTLYRSSGHLVSLGYNSSFGTAANTYLYEFQEPGILSNYTKINDFSLNETLDNHQSIRGLAESVDGSLITSRSNDGMGWWGAHALYKLAPAHFQTAAMNYELNYPSDIFLKEDNRLLIVSGGGNEILEFASGSSNGRFAARDFSSTSYIEDPGNGFLYVIDASESRIVLFDRNDGTYQEQYSSLPADAIPYISGTASDATFLYVMATDGMLYRVALSNPQNVMTLADLSEPNRVFGGLDMTSDGFLITSSATFASFVDEPALASMVHFLNPLSGSVVNQFSVHRNTPAPYRVAACPSGSVYVASRVEAEIDRYDRMGNLEENMVLPGPLPSNSTWNAHFSVQADGHLYVSRYYQHDVLQSHERVDNWAGFPVDENGYCDTDRFVGWMDVKTRPWLWSYSFGKFLFALDPRKIDFGLYLFFPRFAMDGTAGTDWFGYGADAQDNVDTGTWLGWINVAEAPWIWSYSLNKYLFIPVDPAQSSGSWIFVPQFP